MSRINLIGASLCKHHRMKNRVQRYVKADGSIPFQQWFNHLPAAPATKVQTALARMEKGKLSNIKWFAGIGEYVIDWGPGYRVYLARDGADLIILFGGGTKKRQQIDITRAKFLYEEFKLRKKAGKGDPLWS